MAGDRYRSFFYRDVLLLVAMVTIECTNVGLNTLYKAATLQGMSHHVFVVYSYAVGAFLLLPAPFVSNKLRVLPPMNISIISKIGLMGIIGSWGIPELFTVHQHWLNSAISNLLPAFTFILAIIFRMETLSLSNKSFRAKLVGTIVSIAGAFVVTLYKGPKLISSLWSSPSNSPSVSLGTSQPNWALGGLFLTAEYTLLPLCYIVQAQIMKEYPAELVVVFFYDLIVSLLAAIVGSFIEQDSSAWKIKPDIALASILCSGMIGLCLNISVHTWALRLKGPLFVVMFKPLSIAIAVVMGVMFLGDDLYLGSVIGATIISIGFYTVMWGKAKEVVLNDEVMNSDSSSMSRSPLLRYYKDDVDVERS